MLNSIMMIDSLIALDQHILIGLNGSNSMFLDSFVVLLTSGITWIPLYFALFYMVVKNNETMGQIALTMGAAFLCILLTGGVDDILIKPWVSRLRPCNDPMIRDSLSLVYRQVATDYSFFSAHAADTMSLAVFFCLLVRNRFFNAAMLCWTLLNGWTRLYLGLHYPSDVLCGFLYGALVGVLIYVAFYKLYFKISPKLNYISTQYTSTGYDKIDIDVVLSVFILTLSVATVCSIVNIEFY